MSFILDALRKSEQDRQRGSVPDISQTGITPPPRRRSLWLPIVGLLAGLNVSLLGVLWLTSGDDGPPAAVPVPVPVPAPAAQAPRPTPAVPAKLSADTGRSLSSELETKAPQPRAQPPRTPGNVVVSPVTMSGAVPAAAAPDIDYPPTLTELQLDGSISLEPLRMDLHVYSTNPDERFVFINNARYREGERLTAGPAIEQITDIGVILNYQGRDFLLTRD